MFFILIFLLYKLWKKRRGRLDSQHIRSMCECEISCSRNSLQLSRLVEIVNTEDMTHFTSGKTRKVSPTPLEPFREHPLFAHSLSCFSLVSKQGKQYINFAINHYISFAINANFSSAPKGISRPPYQCHIYRETQHLKIENIWGQTLYGSIHLNVTYHRFVM